MNKKRYYIKQVLDDWNNIKTEGIWLSGEDWDGEYKQWYDNGQLWQHCFYKNGKEDGEYKEWHENGVLY